jgi:hypothetical protein
MGRDSLPLWLPVIETFDNYMHIEALTRGHNKIIIWPETNPAFAPELVKVTNMPFEILTNFSPALYLPPYEGKTPWVAYLPHITGWCPANVTVVVGYGTEENMEVNCLPSIQEKKDCSDILATFAYTERAKIYPDKTYNIPTAMISILEWQIKNGPLVPGKEYSYLKMTGVTDVNRFKYLNPGLEAGGICALASTLCKTLYVAQGQDLAKISARRVHTPDFQYAENWMDPAIKIDNTDATVGWVPETPVTNPSNTDLKFYVSVVSYLSFHATIFYNEKPVDKTNPSRHKISTGDTRLIFSATLQRTDPLSQTHPETGLNTLTQLEKVRKDYAAFHDFDDGFIGGFTDKTEKP